MKEMTATQAQDAEAANFAARNVLFDAKQKALAIVFEEARREPIGSANYVRLFDALEAYTLCDSASKQLLRSYIARGV